MTGLRNTRKPNRDQSAYDVTQSCQTSFEQSKRTPVAHQSCVQSTTVMNQTFMINDVASLILTAKLTGPLVLAVSVEQRKSFFMNLNLIVSFKRGIN